MGGRGGLAVSVPYMQSALKHTIPFTAATLSFDDGIHVYSDDILKKNIVMLIINATLSHYPT